VGQRQAYHAFRDLSGNTLICRMWCARSCRFEDVRSDGLRVPLGQLNVGSGVRFGSQNGTLVRCHRSCSASALCSVL